MKKKTGRRIERGARAKDLINHYRIPLISKVERKKSPKEKLDWNDDVDFLRYFNCHQPIDRPTGHSRKSDEEVLWWKEFTRRVAFGKITKATRRQVEGRKREALYG